MALYDSSNKASKGKITHQNALILRVREEGEMVKTKGFFTAPSKKKRKASNVIETLALKNCAYSTKRCPHFAWFPVASHRLRGQKQSKMWRERWVPWRSMLTCIECQGQSPCQHPKPVTYVTNVTWHTDSRRFIPCMAYYSTIPTLQHDKVTQLWHAQRKVIILRSLKDLSWQCLSKSQCLKAFVKSGWHH